MINSIIKLLQDNLEPKDWFERPHVWVCIAEELDNLFKKELSDRLREHYQGWREALESAPIVVPDVDQPLSEPVENAIPRWSKYRVTMLSPQASWDVTALSEEAARDQVLSYRFVDDFLKVQDEDDVCIFNVRELHDDDDDDEMDLCDA